VTLTLLDISGCHLTGLPFGPDTLPFLEVLRIADNAIGASAQIIAFLGGGVWAPPADESGGIDPKTAESDKNPTDDDQDPTDDDQNPTDDDQNPTRDGDQNPTQDGENHAESGDNQAEICEPSPDPVQCWSPSGLVELDTRGNPFHATERKWREHAIVAGRALECVDARAVTRNERLFLARFHRARAEKGAKTGQNGQKTGPNGPKMGPNGPKMGPNGQKTGPNGPKTGQIGPMGSKIARNGQKTARDGAGAGGRNQLSLEPTVLHLGGKS
jgi:hypothetical protein